jgi:hypothetical protein
VVMNSGTQAAKEAGNMVDLDSDPTKLLEVVETGKALLMTRGSPPQHQRICALVTTVLKLEEEATTMKQLLIQMSARLLRLELALSVLDKDGSLTAILRPEQFQPEQF